VSEVLPIEEAGELAPAVDVHIQEVGTLFCVGILPTVSHHVSDGERFRLELEEFDCFITDHVGLSVVFPRAVYLDSIRFEVLGQVLFQIFPTLQVPVIEALTLARLRLGSLRDPVDSHDHRHHDSAHDGKA
jgi:hypothetical protein